MRQPDPDSVFNTSMKWKEMSRKRKMVFLGKIVVTLLTFGFVFPRSLE